MIKHLRIFWTILKNAYIRDSKIPGTLLSRALFQLVEIAITLVFFDVVFSNTDNLAGWNYYQVLFLYAFAKLIISINGAFTRGGLREMANNMVRRGDYDFYLVKPANPMFMVTISKPQIFQFLAIVFEIALCFYAAIAGEMHFTFSQVSWFGLLGIFSIFLYYFLNVLTIVPAFWFVRLWSLQDLMFRLGQVMRYPANVFPEFIKIAFMTAFPIIAVSYIPVSTLFSGAKIEYIAYMAALTLIFGLVTTFFWHLGERHYSSASS